MPTDKANKTKMAATKSSVKDNASEEEAEVITVKSSKKPAVETPNVEPVEQQPAAPVDTAEEVKKTASFSLLDADKKPEEKPLEVKTEEPKPETNEKINEAEVSSWIGDTPQKVDEVIQEKSSKLKPILIILIIVLLLGAIGGGIYYYMTKTSKSTTAETPKQETVEPTAEPTVSPTPTASPSATTKIDYKKYKVEILNGSGIPGEANKVKELIVKTGFTSIKTGNADNYDYTDTIISIKKDTPPQVYDAISKDLEGTYSVKADDKNLDAASAYDVVITVGTKK